MDYKRGKNMKDLIKSKVIILFLIFMVAIALIQEQSIKNASDANTDNQQLVNTNYTLSVTQK